jgi:hypothetical protein
MTTTSTENYKPPAYASAVALLTRLATPLFNRAMGAGEGTQAGEQAFEMWRSLKCLADRISHNRSLDLRGVNLNELRAALSIVHDLAHDVDMNGVPRIAACPCETAERIGAFYKLVDEQAATNAA